MLFDFLSFYYDYVPPHHITDEEYDCDNDDADDDDDDADDETIEHQRAIEWINVWMNQRTYEWTLLHK